MNIRFILLIFSLVTTTALGDPQSPILAPYLSPVSKKDSAMKKTLGQNGKIKILSTDTNGDGKPDIFDYFSNDGALTERREDRNFDGEIDKITTFQSPQNGKIIIKSDENFDGKFDRIEERSVDGDSIVIHIKIDTKFNGTFDFACLTVKYLQFS